MKHASFAQILEEKLQDPRDSSGPKRASLTLDQEPLGLHYLLGAIPKLSLKSQMQYPRQPLPPPPPPQPPQSLSTEEQQAWMFFYEQGTPLKAEIKKGDLKIAFRKLAKRLHPDTNPAANSHELFLRLQKAFKALYCIGL